MFPDLSTLGVKWTKVLARRKVEPADTICETKLNRVLNLLDLTSLGVGSTLGLGVYVLAGAVAHSTAGPAVTISFLIAAIASALAGICYAEFAARVPKAGSAYIYSYVTIGEFCAFAIGWNLILEYAIGTASVAKGLSLYVDSMWGNTMSSKLSSMFPIHVSFLSPYPDFLASSLILLLTNDFDDETCSKWTFKQKRLLIFVEISRPNDKVLLAWGVKESSMVNKIFTIVNLFTVSSVIVAGMFKANPSNWVISKEYAKAHAAHPEEVGEGGFAPFGMVGIMAGAAKCFYGFVGFDIIATTGEEAKNPKRNIPFAIVISLFVIFFSYFGIATVLTMMVPYYEQDVNTPLVSAFEKMNMPYLENLIRFGAVSALSASLLGAIFPLPRILYAMAEDGLLFKYLAHVNEKTKTPMIATLLSGSLAAILSGIFNLEQLMDMMSIGTLLAYTIVTICVLLLRYKVEKENTFKPVDAVFEITDGKPTAIEDSTVDRFKLLFNLNAVKYPSRSSGFISKFALLIFCVCDVLFCFVFEYGHANTTRMYLLLILATSIIVSYVILARQPQSEVSIVFKVPLVPLLPCISIVMNTYLMVKLDVATWIRFVVWLIIGFLIYAFYSVKNSVQGERDKLASSQVNSIKKEEIEMKK